MSIDKTYSTRLNTNSARAEIAQFERIEIFYQGQLSVIKREALPYYLGRDHAACDLVVTGDTVSRTHCVFQFRDHQIGILDTSTNGTYVKPGRAECVFIHNDYYPLVGQGSIKLGQRIDVEDSDVLLYKVLTI